ncbi:hypothetical protein EV651_1061, partial [Kribbella sp. VKM Ac-2571]
MFVKWSCGCLQLVFGVAGDWSQEWVDLA